MLHFADLLPVGQSGPKLTTHAHDAKAYLKYASLAEVTLFVFYRSCFTRIVCLTGSFQSHRQLWYLVIHIQRFCERILLLLHFLASVTSISFLIHLKRHCGHCSFPNDRHSQWTAKLARRAAFSSFLPSTHLSSCQPYNIKRALLQSI